MKSAFLPLFIVAAFVSVAVFGFVAMNLEGGAHHGGCLASSAAGSAAPCPENAFFSALFHISAFKNFSLGILSQSFLSLAFALLAAFVVHISSVFREGKTEEMHLVVARMRELAMRNSFPHTRRFMKWLSLREKLDPAAALSG